MDPESSKKSISYVVCRLVRQWVRAKYGVTIPDFEVQCGPRWADDDMGAVLARVRHAPTITNDGIICEIQIVIPSVTPPSFQGCMTWVADKKKSSIFPPLVVRTKSGDWVLVVNQGNSMLQGHSSKSGRDTDYVYVDTKTFDAGCPITDIRITRYESPGILRNYLCCCFGGAPPLTDLYKAGSDVDVEFKQTELDTALLEQMDDYESVLS
jgi:hypothetical protein